MFTVLSNPCFQPGSYRDAALAFVASDLCCWLPSEGRDCYTVLDISGLFVSSGDWKAWLQVSKPWFTPSRDLMVTQARTGLQKGAECQGTGRKPSALLCAVLGGRWCCWPRNCAAEAAELLRQTPADNCNDDGSQSSSEISRHHSGWRRSQNLKQPCYDLWE